MVNSRMFALYPLTFDLSYHYQFNTKYDYTVQSQPRNFFFDLINFVTEIRIKELQLSRKKKRFLGKMTANIK